MARAEQRAVPSEIRSQSALSSALLQSTCIRCGGFLVNEVSMDLMINGGQSGCLTTRCVQCGDILDPVILHNRRIRQQPMAQAHPSSN